LIKAVVLLAIDRIAAQQSAPRKRGGQIGNQNAAKKHSSNEAEIEKTNKNEAETNKNETKQSTQVPISAPQPANVAPAPASSASATPAPANLNLNINNLNNINIIKFLESENESENEKRSRIKNSLKRYGFCLTDKTVNKIISSVPDTMWLIDGYDFPSYLAKSVSEKYRNKGKTTLDLQKIFLSALDRKDTWEAWDTYPNWLSEKMEQVLVDKKALLRKTPPRNYCPDCGENAKLDGLKCPQCGGFYEFDDATNTHTFVHHLNFDFMDTLMRYRQSKNRNEQGAVNAGIK
jgi:hypothetical protein